MNPLEQSEVISTHDQPAGMRKIAALKHRDYRNTWLAHMFSSGAMWTFIVASGWMVLEKADSSGWVGIVTFASMLPLLVVSPIGGLLGDIYDRRKLALISLVLNTLAAGLLAILSITNSVQLWHIAALAFAGGVLRAIQEPAIQALIPNQVPREDLLNALILSGATRHGARFFGLLVAAPLLATEFVGVSGVLILSALFYAMGGVQMVRTHTTSTGQTSSEQSLLRNMMDGIAYIYTHQAIALLMIMVVFHCALVMSFESILPIFSRESLGATDGSIFGYLIMGFGAGSLAGMFMIAGIRNQKRQGQLLALTGVVSGATPIILAVSGNAPIAILSAAGMGASQATFMALTNTYIQMLAPDRLRARISSLYILHAGGIMAFANLGYGFMADVLSAPPILIGTGIIFMIIMVSLGTIKPILRHFYHTGKIMVAQP